MQEIKRTKGGKIIPVLKYKTEAERKAAREKTLASFERAVRNMEQYEH